MQMRGRGGVVIGVYAVLQFAGSLVPVSSVYVDYGTLLRVDLGGLIAMSRGNCTLMQLYVDGAIDCSHFKVFTRVVPFFSIVMRGEFSRRSVKKTGAEVFSDA